MKRPGEELRLAMVGCGNIAEFHAPACRAAGFDLVAVCGRPGSARAATFAARHGIPRVCGDVDELLARRAEWDVVIVAVSVEPTLDVVRKFLDCRAPMLVEKPVALRSAELSPLLESARPVLVGYNRRFYAPAQIRPDLRP